MFSRRFPRSSLIEKGKKETETFVSVALILGGEKIKCLV